MNKYYGKIGFMETVKASEDSDIYIEQIVEHPYYGDIMNYGYRWQGSQYGIDNKLVTVKISIVADPYAYEHVSNIKYIVWNRNKWKVSSIDIEYPRLILTIGDLYNEQKTSITG